jgi:hypothetical protein
MILEFNIYYSKKKALLFSLLAFSFIILAYLLLLGDYVIIPGNSSFDNVTTFDIYFSRTIGVVSLIIAVFVPVILLRLILKKSPVISITTEGIFFNNYQNYYSVYWSQVKGFAVHNDLIIKNVAVNLKEPQEYVKNLDQHISGMKKKTVTFSMNTSIKKFGTPLLINTMLLSCDAEEFAKQAYSFYSEASRN